MIVWCALWLAAQAADPAPAGDPPPPPVQTQAPPDVADDANDASDDEGSADDEEVADDGEDGDDGEGGDDDGAPAPDARTRADGEPVGAPPRPVSTTWSIAVGAFGGGVGAIVGAIPVGAVALMRPTVDDDALLAILALSAIPSAAALGAGALAVLLVLDRPTMEDVAGVAVCTGLSCLAATVAALLVGIGAGGAGCGGGGGSCGSCGSGSCNDPTGGDPLDSPAVAHAGGAATGAIVGMAFGVALIAIEIDATPRVRQEAIVIGAATGAGAAFLGALLGGAIGGAIGADSEEDRRLARAQGARR